MRGYIDIACTIVDEASWFQFKPEPRTDRHDRDVQSQRKPMFVTLDIVRVSSR
jgi:hypothetical protein